MLCRLYWLGKRCHSWTTIYKKYVWWGTESFFIAAFNPQYTKQYCSDRVLYQRHGQSLSGNYFTRKTRHHDHCTTQLTKSTLRFVLRSLWLFSLKMFLWTLLKVMKKLGKKSVMPFLRKSIFSIFDGVVEILLRTKILTCHCFDHNF